MKTLLEFQNILLGSKTRIYTNHMSNINPITKYTSKQVEYWYQIIEEFRPAFVYLKGLANNLANVLSYLDTGKQVT